MAIETLSAGVWLCVNPGSAYAPGVEVTINVEKTTASLLYEWKISDTIAPTYIDDISEPIQSLSVKAVDGKGFLWLLSQSVKVDVQIETITPAFSSITFPSGMASETKQDDQLAELQDQTTELQAQTQKLIDIETAIGTPMQQTGGSISVVGGNLIAVKVDGSAVTQPVSVAAIPLAADAAKESKQDDQILIANDQTTLLQQIAAPKVKVATVEINGVVLTIDPTKTKVFKDFGGTVITTIYYDAIGRFAGEV